MATKDPIRQAGGPEASGEFKSQDFVEGRVFVRNATGLVRSASSLDLGVLNICGNLSIPIATGLFYAYAIWPHTDFPVAILLGGLLCAFTWFCWALLAATMPRTGGGYIFNTRIIGPRVGFAADWLQFVSTVIAMALWTTWLTTVGLTGVFAIWGALKNNNTVAGWVPAISHPGWIFLIGCALTFAVFGVAAKSLKLSFRFQNTTFFISLIGLIIAIIALLLVGNASYINHFNTFAHRYTHRQDSYHYIIALAKANGFTHGGYKLSDTLGSIYVVLTVSVWAWSSAYLAGEQRGARSVGRQLRVMVGSGSFQILILFLTAFVFLHTAGNAFFGSINYLNTIGKNPLPAPPFYTLLAGVVVSNPVLAALLVFSFVFNIWCGLSELVATSSRPLFAYAFDGLLPSKVAEVNERTHTPLYALGLLCIGCIGVTAYASFSSASFLEIWSYVGLFSFVMLTVTAVSAILLPFRRREDYERSTARMSVLGIPVVMIAGVLAFITCAIYFALVFIYPSVLGTGTLVKTWSAVGICVLSSLVIYYIARYSRRNSAVPLEAAFAEIPPE